jgi:hypothetical protein
MKHASDSTCLSERFLATNRAFGIELIQRFGPSGRFGQLSMAEALENAAARARRPKLMLTFQRPVFTV